MTVEAAGPALSLIIAPLALLGAACIVAMRRRSIS